MQLVLIFCQTSFPARHTLQSATAFLFKVLVHTVLVGWGFFLSVLHCIKFIVHSPWKAEIVRGKKKNLLFIQYTHTTRKKSNDHGKKSLILVIVSLYSMVQAMPCAI